MRNTAVDTVAVADTVTWAWNAAEWHMIESTRAVPAIFRNGVMLSSATHSVTYKNPGAYTYDCGVPAMTGVIVVQ